MSWQDGVAARQKDVVKAGNYRAASRRLAVALWLSMALSATVNAQPILVPFLTQALPEQISSSSSLADLSLGQGVDASSKHIAPISPTQIMAADDELQAIAAKRGDTIVLHGTLRQGALIRASVTPGSEVQLNGQPLKVSPTGLLAFGFEREAAKQTLSIYYPDGRQQQLELVITPQHYRIQHVTGIAKQIMQPSKASITRAKQDAAQVRAARNEVSNGDGFAQTFIWPVTGRISGVYGSQRVYNGEPGRPHYGIDIAAPRGTGVKAPADGVVTLAVADMFYSGGTMIIDHGYGVSSSFLHLSQLRAKVGDKVKQGQIVANVGSSGRSTGPHLDWRINWFQMRLDPATVVGPMPE